MNSFDSFFKTPEINMLQAALPYLSSQMRKSLALYIKSSEMQRIFSEFDKEEVLSACGFEPSAPNPEAMLQAMKLAGGQNTMPQIDQLLHMMNLLKTYQKINDMIQQNPEMMAFLNHMINQPPANQTYGEEKEKPTKQSHHSSSNNISSPAELLKQFSSADNSDMMNLLSQMLKNSR